LVDCIDFLAHSARVYMCVANGSWAMKSGSFGRLDGFFCTGEGSQTLVLY
jgi:hypothetical protein